MREEKKTYPVLKVDLDAIRTNARVVCELCAGKGIEVAGVIKFSDGDLAIAEAYSSGGCRQIASSRTVHLKRIKEEMPQIRTMLIRIPMLSETEGVVRYCDISLNSEEIVEIADKPSAPAGARKNWAGHMIECEDRGIRRRALVALGSQDIGDPKQLIPLDEGMEIVGGSSDHTIIDVTECGKELIPGDTIHFRAFYMPLLYCFATRHVNIVHQGV